MSGLLFVVSPDIPIESEQHPARSSNVQTASFPVAPYHRVTRAHGPQQVARGAEPAQGEVGRGRIVLDDEDQLVCCNGMEPEMKLKDPE
jgi:hypothetical protein